MDYKELAETMADDRNAPFEFARHYLGEALNSITRATDAYAMMLTANPDLEDLRKVDQSRFQRFFLDLWRQEPFKARTPTIAATAMRQMMASPDTAGSVILNLSKR